MRPTAFSLKAAILVCLLPLGLWLGPAALAEEGTPDKLCDDYPPLPADKADEVEKIKEKAEAVLEALKSDPGPSATATPEQVDAWMERYYMLRSSARCLLKKIENGKLRMMTGGPIGLARAKPKGAKLGACGMDCIVINVKYLCDPAKAYGFPTFMHEGRHTTQTYPGEKWPETVNDRGTPCEKLEYRMGRAIRELEANTVGFLAAQVDGVYCEKYKKKVCDKVIGRTPNDGHESYEELFFRTFDKWKEDCGPSDAEQAKMKEAALFAIRTLNRLKEMYPCE